MIYLGSIGGKLTVVPTKGEQMSFVWDLARHIFRTTTLDYKTGDHRKYPGREKLYEIFKRIDLEQVNNIYGQIGKIYSIDEIILLNRTVTGEPINPTIAMETLMCTPRKISTSRTPNPIRPTKVGSI